MSEPTQRQDEFPPRGGGKDGRRERSPAAWWLHPKDHGSEWREDRGAIIIGQHGGRAVTWSDDRHIVTVAGSRGGKSRRVLMPNLKRYPGPVVVIDPKGELAAETAAERERFGPVHILDPFNELARRGVSRKLSSFNPLAELHCSRPETLLADAAQIADALIIAPEKGDRHWTDSAKNLIAGIILHFHTKEPERATLRGLRDALAPGNDDEGGSGWGLLLKAMAKNGAGEGAVANVGRSYLAKLHTNGEFTDEGRSIISTAAEQTTPLDAVRHISDRSDFRLENLSLPIDHPEAVRSLYLILPGMRIGTHARWLRVMIYQALAAFERSPIDIRKSGQLAALFILEEFAALGNISVIETAAGYMAGNGVKLWPVLQDLSQLKRHYPESWETFLCNAGMIQAFANIDVTTTEYLSKLIGQVMIFERVNVHVGSASMRAGAPGYQDSLQTPPLLAPFEVSYHFSRRAERALLLSANHPPSFADMWGKKTPA